jgi:hypothetical protein
VSDFLAVSCGQPTATVIYFAYPWAGHAGNTEDRLRRIAEALRADIIAGHAPGTGRLYTDPLTRRALHANDTELLRQLAVTHAHLVEKEIKQKGYTRRIGWGDSGRSWLIATMALHTTLFTEVLTRDGAILDRIGVAKGALRLLREGGKRFDDPVDPPSELIKRKRTMPQRAYDIAAAVAEMGVYRDIMCTTDVTVQSLRDLAEHGSIPFCNVMLEHGISGTPSEVQAFNIELERLRGRRNKFLGTYELGLGHGNLQDWRIAVRHLKTLNQITA